MWPMCSWAQSHIAWTVRRRPCPGPVSVYVTGDRRAARAGARTDSGRGAGRAQVLSWNSARIRLPTGTRSAVSRSHRATTISMP